MQRSREYDQKCLGCSIVLFSNKAGICLVLVKENINRPCEICLKLPFIYEHALAITVTNINTFQLETDCISESVLRAWSARPLWGEICKEVCDGLVQAATFASGKGKGVPCGEKKWEQINCLCMWRPSFCNPLYFTFTDEAPEEGWFGWILGDEKYVFITWF